MTVLAQFLSAPGALWLLACVGQAAELPPLSNIAAFGRVSVADLQAPYAHTDVPSLASPSSPPIALVPGNVLLVEWTQPRAVHAVELEFAGTVPAPGTATVEWWRRIWPDNGAGGWMKLDDPFNGQWTAARTASSANGARLALHLTPLDTTEAPGVKRTGLDYRLTYKLRISLSQPVSITHLAVFSEAVTRRARLRFEWNLNTTVRGAWAPRFEARNGRILKTTVTSRNAAIVEVEYADSPDRLSADRGQVLCRSGETRSFSVFVDDVLREGGLFVRDIGAFVSDADKSVTFKTWSGPPGEVWKEGTVAEQVAHLPEQSFAHVQPVVPPKPPTYLFLGVPNLRQEIALGPEGDIQLCADSLRSPGPDADMRPWKWDDLRYQFGAGEQPVMGPKTGRTVARRLEEGWLPIVRHEWTNDQIAYVQTSLAAPLLGDIATLNSQTGTEPVVLATRFEIQNTTASPRTAWLWLALNHPMPWHLAVDGTLVLHNPSDGRARPDLLPVRGRFNTCAKGSLDLAVIVPAAPGDPRPTPPDSSAVRDAVRYRVDLGPGEAHALELFVPYIELLDVQELAALKAMSFTNLHDSVARFWKTRVSQHMTCEVPDLYLNEFFKANLWHVLISTDIDPLTGQHQHGAATHQYRNFLNETAMVTRSLEMRGEHEAAQKLIETLLANQGVKGLPGNFRTKTGVLYAAHPEEPDPYTAQGYNMHHGWGMWVAAEHYFWTRDRDYLLRWAQALINACDWVTRERQATRRNLPDGSRPVEFGLAPAGDLEDVEEYLYYYATDAYYHLGMKQVAAALGAVTQASTDTRRLRRSRAEAAATAPGAAPAALARLAQEALRLARDAEAFRQDIRASVAESVATSPVVQLRDGSYVPFVPPRAYALTHLKEGWIREGLYPALHLVNGEIYDPRHPFVRWMIQDLEDNIFLSRESGYGVENPKAGFFNLGGFTLQPNLLDLALVYLQRDETPNFLRAFYNTGWASLYPDAVCFAEWVPAFGQGGGPLYKTPDECKFIQWLRQMLVLERGDCLELGLGVPRAWMTEGKRVKVERAATYFGSLDLEILSHAASEQITATVKLTPTVAPKAIGLRLRHPEGRPITAARVNGRPARVDALRQIVDLPATGSVWQVEALFKQAR